MGRPGGPGPLDPIFDVDTVFGAIAYDNTPGSLPLTVTINKGSGQPDPATSPPIVFDVIFSRAVTGFATGDVTLSGTAGATTATVVDSGDHIQYTVNVTGMDTTGFVTATIASGVCVALDNGMLNRASTSTDNTVDWEEAALAGLVGWWDASLLSSVTGMPNLVGSPYTMTPNGGDWSIGTVNGLHVVSRDLYSVTAAIQGTSSPASPINGLSNFDIFFVGRCANPANGGVLLSASTAGSNRPEGIVQGGGSGHFYMTGSTALVTGVLSDNIVRVFCWQFNGASSKIYIDGVLEATGTVGTALANQVLTFLNNGPLSFGVEAATLFAECKICNVNNTEASILAECAALADKWIP